MRSSSLPIGWHWVTLGAVAKWGSGGTPSRSKEEYYGGDIPWIKTGELNDSIIFDTEEKLSAIGLKNSSAKMFPADSIAIAMYGATIGKLGILGVEASCNQACAVAIPLENLYNMYLFYYLKASKEGLVKRGQGGAQPNISQEIIKSFPIPVPPIDIQKRIASALAEADALIQKRKEAIAKLDGLVESIFYEMFGDYRFNNKSWSVCELKDVITDITAGWSVGGEERKKLPEEKAVLKISAVTSGIFNPSAYKVVKPENYLLKTLVHPMKGDILFSRANTRELVGATCMVDDDYDDLFLPDKLWKLKFLENCNPYYLLSVLQNKWFREKLSSKATGTSGSMLNISKEKFLEMPLYLPPRELQDQYGDICFAIQNQKSLMENQLAKLEENFQSLLHQAFTGQLQFRE
ncbi:restriction endonuclease subunit S [Paenibacillus cremeus]|uniref:restriction endonuclease subunit S n=1 Tax=Paenibacillus cremeus TaxID=2163881 RepID=UPI0021BD983A|nr:restriction endonuclease subunit S [Paenibacillus cremeus]